MLEEDELYKQLLRKVARIEHHHPMAQYNRLGIGGMATYFTVAEDMVELVQAAKAAMEAHLPLLVLTEGSTVVFGEKPYPGLVIQNRSQDVAFSYEQSQVVVDSGMSLQRLISLAVGKGFGGILPFYRWGGSVGGACYHNRAADSLPFSDFLRSITVLLPPSRIKPEASIIRHKPNWLHGRDGSGRLQELRRQRGIQEPTPIILTVQIQLTSVRSDELARRLQREAELFRVGQPGGEAFGPLFLPLAEPGELEERLRAARVDRLRHRGLFTDKRFPNYLRYRPPRRESPATGTDVADLVQAIQRQIQEQQGVTITPAFEVVDDKIDSTV